MTGINREILKITGAAAIIRSESVQTLWSGYGAIKRIYLEGGKSPSVIVKHIHWPEENRHPKGWNTEISHQRKLRSYQVEKSWYSNQARQTNDYCRVPQVCQIIEEGSELWLIMEDLDASGYHIRLTPDSVTLADAKKGLTWLAHFHGAFMGEEPTGLWPIGTYWHLETRPDEWAKIKNENLKEAATEIDTRLKEARFQTILHGDAKLANFCFSKSGEVAAVDFQYVGSGCGMKDVAYFISSCFEADECERLEVELLSHYFDQLEVSLRNTIDFQQLKKEWVSLYPYAWADLYRFLDGWSPGHWKMHAYSKRLTNQVINQLNK